MVVDRFAEDEEKTDSFRASRQLLENDINAHGSDQACIILQNFHHGPTDLPCHPFSASRLIHPSHPSLYPSLPRWRLAYPCACTGPFRHGLPWVFQWSRRSCILINSYSCLRPPTEPVWPPPPGSRAAQPCPHGASGGKGFRSELFRLRYNQVSSVAVKAGGQCIDTMSELEACGGCLHGEFRMGTVPWDEGKYCSARLLELTVPRPRSLDVPQ